MKGFGSKIDLFIATSILVTVSLGCLGPGSGGSKCQGTVKVEGRTYVGEAKDENQAGLNACNKYCTEEDDTAKGMIQIWLASGAAADFERKMKRKPTREDAVIEDKSILDYVTNKCAVKCKADANKGKHSLETKCS